MALSHEDMVRLAELARLELGEEELARLGGDLDAILGYVGRLSAIDTSGVAESDETVFASPPGIDRATACDTETREFIIGNFPDRLGDALRVPAVFDKPKS